MSPGQMNIQWNKVHFLIRSFIHSGAHQATDFRGTGRVQPISEFLWFLESLANCSAITWYLIAHRSRYPILNCKFTKATDHTICIFPWTHPLSDKHMNSPSIPISWKYLDYHYSGDPCTWYGSARMANCQLSLLITHVLQLHEPSLPILKVLAKVLLPQDLCM